MTHQILTGHPIDLKLVANRAGWILMNLQIPHACLLSLLICFIGIMMVGGAILYIKYPNEKLAGHSHNFVDKKEAIIAPALLRLRSIQK